MKVLSSFTHPRVIPNMHGFLPLNTHKKGNIRIIKVQQNHESFINVVHMTSSLNSKSYKAIQFICVEKWLNIHC